MIARPATTVKPRPGVVDLYRALGVALTSGWTRAARYVEVAVIVSWFVLRTVDANPLVMALWVGVAAALAVLAPTSGLVILAAIGPFNEGFLLTRDVGVKSLLVLLIVGSVLIRAAPHWRVWRRLPEPIVVGMVVLVGTGAGLAITRMRFGHDFFTGAWQIWLTGIGTMFLTFIAAVWVTRRGELRPLVVACAAATLAGLLSLADFMAAEDFRASFAGWTVTGPSISRLTGVMRSPTSTAALVMLPAMLFLAAAFVARDVRLRVGAWLAAIPMLIAAYFTYNRAVFLALFALAVLLAWRVRPRYGIVLALAGLVLGLALLPSYMALRMEGAGVPPEPGQVLLANDRTRLEAWAASVRMFLDQPLTGQGYRAYREVSPAFGGIALNAPHSEWLRLFAENGIVVGLAGLAFVAATIRWLARVTGWLGLGILGAFISLVLAACFNNPFLFNQVTIPAFIITGTGVALAALVAAPPAAPPAAEPAPASEPADES
ncbi:MAG TPA: O-antigen ligase family protein [Candidatus Limnocylindrales bacterium]|nr:O-antigen ligase family protein [Candidatus Limnocylindrales bacterium]